MNSLYAKNKLGGIDLTILVERSDNRKFYTLSSTRSEDPKKARDCTHHGWRRFFCNSTEKRLLVELKGINPLSVV